VRNKVRAKFATLTNVRLDVLSVIKLINAILIPIIIYGIEIIPWKVGQINRFNKDIRLYVRKLLGLPNISNKALYTSLGLRNIEDIQKSAVASYKAKVKNNITTDAIKAYNKCKVKKVPIRITNYRSLIIVTENKPNPDLTTSVNPNKQHLVATTKEQLKELKEFPAKKQRFYFSYINDITYCTKKHMKKSESKCCRFCGDRDKDDYEHWENACTNKKIREIFNEEKKLNLKLQKSMTT